jgi:predicted component of type VI protein secretion system
LKQIISDRLAAPVTIRELTGGWYSVAPENRAQLGETRRGSELGETCVLGDTVLVPAAAITVEIGPVSEKHAQAFWMDGSALERCRSLVAFMVGEALEFAIDLLVDSSETSGCVLGDEEHHAIQLGLNMWLDAPSPRLPARTRIWPRHYSGGC